MDYLRTMFLTLFIIYSQGFLGMIHSDFFVVNDAVCTIICATDAREYMIDTHISGDFAFMCTGNLRSCAFIITTQYVAVLHGSVVAVCVAR